MATDERVATKPPEASAAADVGTKPDVADAVVDVTDVTVVAVAESPSSVRLDAVVKTTDA